MFKLICVTNRRLCREDFSLRLAKIAAAGPDAIILREKDLPAAAYQRLAEQALSICGQYEAPCVLHSFAQQALGLGAPRLHLPLPLHHRKRNHHAYHGKDKQGKRKSRFHGNGSFPGGKGPRPFFAICSFSIIFFIGLSYLESYFAKIFHILKKEHGPSPPECLTD